ncbi:MAG: HPF/RaiA family ribosome-associated protein [Thiohalomonadales bacterium]
MNIPLKIQLVNFIPSESIKDKIESKLTKLNRLEYGINNCRIILESHYDKILETYFYEVKINLTMVDNVIVTNRYSNTLGKFEDIYVAIWRAFLSIRQQLDFYHKSVSHRMDNKMNTITLGSGIKLQLRGATRNQ